MKRTAFNLILFIIGGLSYGLIEIAWRQYTHWSMVITGGICLVLLYRLYTVKPDLSLPERCLYGSLIITSAELICGFIVNIRLNLGVWDYSRLPLNFMGQICLLYSVLWGFLCIPVSYLCIKLDTLEHRLFSRHTAQSG